MKFFSISVFEKLVTVENILYIRGPKSVEVRTTGGGQGGGGYSIESAVWSCVHDKNIKLSLILSTGRMVQLLSRADHHYTLSCSGQRVA